MVDELLVVGGWLVDGELIGGSSVAVVGALRLDSMGIGVDTSLLSEMVSFEPHAAVAMAEQHSTTRAIWRLTATRIDLQTYTWSSTRHRVAQNDPWCRGRAAPPCSTPLQPSPRSNPRYRQREPRTPAYIFTTDQHPAPQNGQVCRARAWFDERRRFAGCCRRSGHLNDEPGDLVAIIDRADFPPLDDFNGPILRVVVHHETR